MKKTLKGVTLIEIILSMAVYAVIALLLCEIMTTINMTMKSTTAMDRRFSAEAQYADNGITPEGEAVFAVPTGQSISSISVTGEGVSLNIDTLGLSVSEAQYLDSDHDYNGDSDPNSVSHFKFLSFRGDEPPAEAPDETAFFYPFDIKLGDDRINLDDLSQHINVNVSKVVGGKFTIMDDYHEFITGGTEFTFSVPSGVRIGESIIQGDKPTILRNVHAAVAADGGLDDSEMSIYDPRSEVIVMHVELYALLSDLSYTTADFVDSTMLQEVEDDEGVTRLAIRLLESTFNLADHKVMRDEDAEAANPARERFRKSFLYYAPDYSLVCLNTDDESYNNGRAGLNFKIESNEKSENPILFRAEEWETDD